MKRIIIATQNKNKAKELAEILDGFEVVTMKEAGINIDIEENGSDFEENALIKAETVARISGQDAIADDSGLEIMCLGKRPGIFSARYGGENISYEKKMRLLLSEIKSTGSTDRSAQFVCAIAYVGADGSRAVFRGECKGVIADRACGEGGFGYDPIFIADGYGKTFAQLPAKIKNKISHRAVALEQLKEYVEKHTAP